MSYLSVLEARLLQLSAVQIYAYFTSFTFHKLCTRWRHMVIMFNVERPSWQFGSDFEKLKLELLGD